MSTQAPRTVGQFRLLTTRIQALPKPNGSTRPKPNGICSEVYWTN
uniref:Uncharacterized protein n=1 Tax=Arundo donax TaxID=35708 RepID=A0A0A8XQS1_ARUDO